MGKGGEGEEGGLGEMWKGAREWSLQVRKSTNVANGAISALKNSNILKH